MIFWWILVACLQLVMLVTNGVDFTLTGDQAELWESLVFAFTLALSIRFAIYEHDEQERKRK